MKIDNTTNKSKINGQDNVFDLNLKNLSASEDRVFRAQAGFSEPVVDCIVTTGAAVTFLIC